MLSTNQFRDRAPAARGIRMGWVLSAIGVALLAMMIAYPAGYDQSVFSVGGEMILKQHSIPNHDFLDTKPPLIFYLYAFAIGIFGHHTSSIRIFDFFFQAFSLFYFYRVLRRHGLDSSLSAIAVFMTLVQYVGSGFWSTAQAESFQLLPAVVMIDMTLRSTGQSATSRDQLVFGILAGAALAIIFFLKFTLILIAPAIVLFLILDRAGTETAASKTVGSIRFLLSLCMTSALLVALYAAFLITGDYWSRFVESLVWVSNYAALFPLFSMQTVAKQYYTLFPQRLIATFLPTFLAAGLIGLSHAIRTRDREIQVDSKSASLPTRLLLLLGIVSVFGLLGVLYERKMFQYHYTRAFWAFTPFVAIGLARGCQLLAETWASARHRWSIRVCLTAIVIAAIFYSSFTQVLSHPVRWTVSVLSHEDPFEVVQQRVPEYFAADMKRVADTLAVAMKPDDQLFFWGNEVGLYFELNRLPTTIALTNTPLRTAFTPDSWKKSVTVELQQHPPRFVVAQFGDAEEFITGSPDDSYQAMMQWDDLRNFITSHYHVMRTMKHFIIYERL